jgi:hypothetical protein
MQTGVQCHAEVFLQWERAPVRIAQETWWAPGQIYTIVSEKIFPLRGTDFKSPSPQRVEDFVYMVRCSLDVI